MGTKQEVVINWPVAVIVFSFLMEALTNKRWPYNVAQQPHIEENMPKLLKKMGRSRRRMEARFFVVVCYYMLGGIESETAFRGISKVFDRHPEFFTTNFAKLTDQERAGVEKRLRRILARARLNRRSKEISKQWVANFTKLDTYWRGDPRRLFAKTTEFDELCRRLMNGNGDFNPKNPNGFYGFREKMVSMLAFFLMDQGLMPYYPLPVPIDFHALRILTACGILSVPDYKFGENLLNIKYLAAAREVAYRYCVEYDVSWMRLCDCLWLLGITGCKWHPDNWSEIAGERKARKTEIRPLPYKWTKARVQTYNNTCGKCPIRKQCIFAVPSMYYYLIGKLVIRGLLTKLAHQEEFWPEDA